MEAPERREEESEGDGDAPPLENVNLKGVTTGKKRSRTSSSLEPRRVPRTWDRDLIVPADPLGLLLTHMIRLSSHASVPVFRFLK